MNKTSKTAESQKNIQKTKSSFTRNAERRIFSAERIFLIFSFVFLSAAATLSFVLPAETRTLIPFPEITVPAVNTISALVCFFLIFKTRWQIPQYAILFVQAIFTIFTGYEIIGIFLYSALIIKLFCNGFFKNHLILKAFGIIFIWLVSILGLIPFGWSRLILAYASIFFFCTFYYYIYRKLENQLSNFLPPSKVETQINLPEPGTKIHLEDFGLSERQIEFVSDYIKNGITYKEIAVKYIVSLSTVKSEMAKVFKKFGVSSKEDLRILLLQYKLE